MVSHKYKFIYARIPKTASTSITSFLSSLEENMKQGHFCLSDEITNQTKDYFKFTFVRNPWDRMVSKFFRDKQNLEDYFLSPVFEGEISEVANNYFEKDFNYFIKNQSEFLPLSAPTYVFNQYPYVLNSEGKEVVDFVGRYENLQESFNQVCEKIGVEPTLLKLVNSSKHGHYSTYYDSESIEIVRNQFKQDVEYFNYEFETI